MHAPVVYPAQFQAWKKPSTAACWVMGYWSASVLPASKGLLGTDTAGQTKGLGADFLKLETRMYTCFDEHWYPDNIPIDVLSKHKCDNGKLGEASTVIMVTMSTLPTSHLLGVSFWL